MTAVVATLDTDPLRPVREALVAQASTDADRLLAEVDAEVDAVVTRAMDEAEAILAEAREQGESDAGVLLVTEQARARRRARAIVLAAQRTAYDELRTRVEQALPALRSGPDYAIWCDRMRAQARRVLGEGAVLTEHPDGGVLGEVEGRRAAYTLPGLADRALDTLGPDVESLWST